MTIPAILFGMLIATLVGAGAHLITGGRPGRLIVYLVLSWMGFWGGHYLADLNDWQLLMVGPLHFGVALLLSLVLVLFGFIFTLERGPVK